MFASVSWRGCSVLIPFLETTAVTLAAAMIYLALNPEIEKEVLQNIIEVVGWNDKPVSNVCLSSP